jgi:hypothetical protein
MVGLAATTDGCGHDRVASDGGGFAYDAPFLGSVGGQPLNAPMVGIAERAIHQNQLFMGKSWFTCMRWTVIHGGMRRSRWARQSGGRGIPPLFEEDRTSSYERAVRQRSEESLAR